MKISLAFNYTISNLYHPFCGRGGNFLVFFFLRPSCVMKPSVGSSCTDYTGLAGSVTPWGRSGSVNDLILYFYAKSYALWAPSQTFFC